MRIYVLFRHSRESKSERMQCVSFPNVVIVGKPRYVKKQTLKLLDSKDKAQFPANEIFLRSLMRTSFLIDNKILFPQRKMFVIQRIKSLCIGCLKIYTLFVQFVMHFTFMWIVRQVFQIMVLVIIRFKTKNFALIAMQN